MQRPAGLSSQSVSFVVCDYTCSDGFTREPESSVCPALLCNPRRNLVSPKAILMMNQLRTSSFKGEIIRFFNAAAHWNRHPKDYNNRMAIAKTNQPSLWQKLLPKPDAASNKYTRGSALIVGGYPITGAARLAAMACARTGAGITTIACPQIALPIYASSMLSVMTKPFDSDKTFNNLISDARISAYLIGPGAGLSQETRAQAQAILSKASPCVIDADAIKAFAGHQAILRNTIQAPCVLTPHEGEFKHLFDLDDDRNASVTHAARQTGAIVLLKGSDTLIADPEGRLIVNENASPTLATAGSGDVLAGIITGLLAQGMPAFEAAAAATWIHAEAARLFGVGLIAEDLIEMLPTVLANLHID